MTNEDLPTNEELEEERLRLANVRQGEINEWAKNIEMDSLVFIGNHSKVMRSMKYDNIDVSKKYHTLENEQRLRIVDYTFFY